MPPRKKKIEEVVVYPEPLSESRWRGTEKGPITEEEAKRLLGWESEEEYQIRMIAENEDLDPEGIGFEDIFDFKDVEGVKIRCGLLEHNRPLTLGHIRRMAQDILVGNWAGPTAFAGQTVNGETIVISRTGRVSSGNHRLVALIFACQMLRKNPAKYRFWKDGSPVLESLVFLGASDDPRVTRTLDNVRPRSLSDVIYTSEIYGSLAPSERVSYSRILGKAISFLWDRVRAGEEGGGKTYRTHAVALEFLGRHMRLLKTVDLVFSWDTGKYLSSPDHLGLSAGMVAGCLYLMGSSGSDRDGYHEGNPPSEKRLSFENWDRAVQFWADLARGDGTTLIAVRSALQNLLVPNLGNLKGEAWWAGQTIILAEAWKQYLAGYEIQPDDLEIITEEDDNGRVMIVEWPGFGGVDEGHPHRTQTPAEVQAAKEALDQERRECQEHEEDDGDDDDEEEEEEEWIPPKRKPTSAEE